MAAKVVLFEQLFVIVGHTNKIKFSKTKSCVDSRRVHISMNKALFVYVSESLA
jgi:hypothetical protein